MSEAQKAPTTRPKLNDVLNTPWRYRCPDCDCTTIVVREKVSENPFGYKEGEKITSYADRRNKDVHIHDFLCGNCRGVFDRPVDSKTDKQTKLTEELQ